MSYYSDLTAVDLERAQAQFTGIYRHVLKHIMNQPRERL